MILDQREMAVRIQEPGLHARYVAREPLTMREGHEPILAAVHNSTGVRICPSSNPQGSMSAISSSNHPSAPGARPSCPARYRYSARAGVSALLSTGESSVSIVE